MESVHTCGYNKNLNKIIESLWALRGPPVNIDGFVERSQPPLHVASRRGYTDIVKQLLEAGVDPNITNHNGGSPLYEACIEGHTDIVKLLLKAGADPNTCNTLHDPPLYLASLFGYLKIVKQLLKYGADVNIEWNNKPPVIRSAGTDEVRKVLQNYTPTLLTLSKINIRRHNINISVLLSIFL